MKRSTRTTAVLALLALATLAPHRSAAAAQRIVLVAPPALGGEITPAVAASLARVMVDALRKVDARPATPEETARAMRQAGVEDLDTRANSTLVGQKLGAVALVRYQAELAGFDLRVRLAVYFLAGKAVMLERSFPLRRLGPSAEQMVAELFAGAPAAESAPATPAATGSPAASPAGEQPPASAPAAPPAPLAQRSATPRIFAQPNPHAQSGVVLRGSFGGIAPLGVMAEALSLGFRAGGEVGYQIRLGRFLALTPEVAFGFARWGSNSTWDAAFPPAAITALSVGLGARFDVFLGPVSVWPALRIGFGRGGFSFADPSSGAPISDFGVALDFAFGVQWMLARGFGVGFALGAHKVFISDFTNDASNTGPFGFSFGLQLTAKIPTGA